MLEIIPLPAFKDNYIWVGVNRSLGQAWVVDPGDAAPVFDFLKQHHLVLTDILVTHKHADHTGGILELLHQFPEISIYAHPTESVAHTTHFVKQNDQVLPKNSVTPFKVISIPGHTLGHIAYYARSILFSGDTLFSAGCGRIFEGTAEQMLHSLNQLAALPDDTLIYCGHEYTLANLQFALHVEPDNLILQQQIQSIEKLRADNHPSLPSSMGIEKKTNPFLRCTEKSIVASVEHYTQRKLTTTVEVFHALREWKNNF